LSPAKAGAISTPSAFFVKEMIPEISARNKMLIDISKNQRWQEMHDRVMQMKDNLGKGVDAGIVDTVIVLNLLGLSTVMSCEGHMEGASGAPWVDIEDSEANKQIQKITHMFQEARAAHARGFLSEHLFDAAHQIRLEAMKKQLILRQKLMDYLAAFYTYRQVPYDVRLVIQSRAAGRSRLESQGADFQEIASPEIRKQKLQVYHEEMSAFTIFLKEQFFQEIEREEQ
jgi:hypothetical protein